jgi:hypothetical protein
MVLFGGVLCRRVIAGFFRLWFGLNGLVTLDVPTEIRHAAATIFKLTGPLNLKPFAPVLVPVALP